MTQVDEKSYDPISSSETNLNMLQHGLKAVKHMDVFIRLLRATAKQTLYNEAA